MRVLGLDLSLVATGVAIDGVAHTWKPPRSSERGVERLAWFFENLEHLCEAHEPNVALIENYSFASKARGEHLGELGGVMRLALHRSGVPFVEVPPKRLKKFATDNGNAGKDEMIAAAIRRWDFEGTSNNEADAWMLYLMGRFHYEGEGAVGRNLPAYAAVVLASIEWPELVPA